MALVKNQMPEFDAEILRRDFTIDEVKCEALVDSTYDTAHYFVSQYNFNREPLAFCMRRYTCRKHKIDDKGRQSGAPRFL
jgi:hypothetical protein